MKNLGYREPACKEWSEPRPGDADPTIQLLRN